MYFTATIHGVMGYPNLFIVKAIGALVPCKLEQVN